MAKHPLLIIFICPVLFFAPVNWLPTSAGGTTKTKLPNCNASLILTSRYASQVSKFTQYSDITCWMRPTQDGWALNLETFKIFVPRRDGAEGTGLKIHMVEISPHERGFNSYDKLLAFFRV